MDSDDDAFPSSLPEAFSLDEIDLYLQTDVKDKNRKDCLRVINRLIHGTGITHRSKPGEVFHHGVTVKPSDDLENLRLKAEQWLPWRQNDPACLDKGHGWAANHPIQKLINFKRVCLQQLDKESGRKRKSVVSTLPRIKVCKVDTVDLSESCLNMARVLDDIPELINKRVRDVTERAQKFIERKSEEGKLSVEAPVIFCGRIPELANYQGEMTTGQVRDHVKQKFKNMTESQYARGWYGLEAYFISHPRGVDKGYVPKQGWLSVDHVLAQYFGMFHHPRFYAFMPPEINSHLRDSPPITRMGFGIKRHDMVQMHTWMKHMETTARKKNIQTLLLSNLVQAYPVHEIN